MLDLSAGRLDGRVAIVVGVEKHSGSDWALALARRGAMVAVVAPSGDDVARTVAAIEATGGTAFGFAGDATDPPTAQRLVAHVEQRLGPIDAIVLATARDAWPLLAATIPALKARGMGAIGVVGHEPLVEEIRAAAGPSIEVIALTETVDSELT